MLPGKTPENIPTTGFVSAGQKRTSGNENFSPDAEGRQGLTFWKFLEGGAGGIFFSKKFPPAILP
jgi:hypothetical protein